MRKRDCDVTTCYVDATALLSRDSIVFTVSCVLRISKPRGKLTHSQDDKKEVYLYF